MTLTTKTTRDARAERPTDGTRIEWADYTFNPWNGCAKVSPGCKHCYADAHDKRHLREPVRHWGETAPRLFASDRYMGKPLTWNRVAKAAGQRARVFCMSMGDLFERHADATIHAKQSAYRAQVFKLIEQTPWLDWLLLTKRPEHFAEMLPLAWLKQPRPNVWLGTSIENQAVATERLPVLLDTPARIRFVSYDPALGPIDLEAAAGAASPGHCVPLQLDWLIAGSEAGPGARPAELDWFRSARDQCQRLGVHFFFKQWVDERRHKTSLPVLDGAQWVDVPASCRAPHRIEVA